MELTMFGVTPWGADAACTQGPRNRETRRALRERSGKGPGFALCRPPAARVLREHDPGLAPHRDRVALGLPIALLREHPLAQPGRSLERLRRHQHGPRALFGCALLELRLECQE